MEQMPLGNRECGISSIIVLGPTVLVVIEKFFSKTSSAGLKAERFYNLLVQDTLKEDDLDEMLRDNRKDIKELRSEFRGSKSFLISYTFKNFLEFAIAVLFGVWITWTAKERIYTCDNSGCDLMNYMFCDMGGAQYTCIVPHTAFYFYLLAFVTLMDAIYILGSLYTLMWLAFPCMRKLSKVINQYKQKVKKASKANNWDLERKLDLLDVYGDLDSADVELLLNLLSEKMGVAPAMRILTILDPEFLDTWKVKRVTQDTSEDIGSTSAMIAFESCPMGHYMNERTTRKLLYVATISPNEEKEAPHSFLHVPETAMPMDSDDGLKPSAPTQYTAKYPYLAPATEYTVTLSTSFNGTEIAEAYVKFTTRPLPPMGLEVKWGFMIDGTDIKFKADITWLPTTSKGDISYFVEVTEEDISIAESVTAPQFHYQTSGDIALKVRLWSVLNGSLKSQECLETTLDPVPQVMKDYVKRLRHRIPDKAKASEYAYQVELLKQVSSEMKDLQKSMQVAAASVEQDRDSLTDGMMQPLYESSDTLPSVDIL